MSRVSIPNRVLGFLCAELKADTLKLFKMFQSLIGFWGFCADVLKATKRIAEVTFQSLIGFWGFCAVGLKAFSRDLVEVSIPNRVLGFLCAGKG